uniref:uncharacterized protein LOC122766049 isoform X1 n=2 Tax=Solea senegalensis TaxID=28829 RepID=UPI001CD85B58|nr:uncharacterized protein LOC122766049 isoform X1 [Solea senegalensis]
MSAVDRRGAREPRWETKKPSRSQDLKPPLGLLARRRPPVGTSTWPPDGSRSAQHKHRGPIYVSFVSKAVLWDRGLCHYTPPVRPVSRPSLCPRFLSHMRARPEDFRPPCFQNFKSRPEPRSPSAARTPSAHASFTTPQTPALEGFFHLTPHRRRGSSRSRHVVKDEGVITGRSSAVVVVPCPPLPVTPSLSTISPARNHHDNLHLDSGGGEKHKANTSPVSPSSSTSSSPTCSFHRSLEDKEESEKMEDVPRAAAASVTDPDVELLLRSAGSGRSTSEMLLSRTSFSDLSRPPSSLFSRSTNLSGRSSILSVYRDSDPGGSGCFSKSSPELQSPVVRHTAAGTRSHQSSTTNTTNTTTSLPLHEQVFGQTKHLSPHPTSHLRPILDKPSSSNTKHKTAEIQHRDVVTDPGLDPSWDSNHGLVPLAFPSTTWSSCPSPESTTTPHCSGSGAKLTPSPPPLQSHRWPVLPPISPLIKGRCGSAASRYSELSCSQSRVFDELEAIAPRSDSCPSLDEASDSSGCPSPDTVLSPGLAALTVGCDSGKLGPLSRVQLLLLDRPEPETLPSPCSVDEEFSPVQDWMEMRMQHDPRFNSEGVLRPLTAGDVSERCDSAGKVQENKSDQSEGGSGSPSSWIIDPSPSHNMFRSSLSPCPSNYAPGRSSDEGGGPDEDDEASAVGRSPESLRIRSEEEEERRTAEERRTNALNMLSKLQEEPPRQSSSRKGCSNFEDFDFLAKYCIFSPEKLEEYERAFEAEDSDGDGYISCLQVLLALKSIVPLQLLSDEEEIYVYRILEMVDFRVTDGLVDLRLFSVIASLAQKVTTMDDFMRSLISSTDFRSLEVRLFKAKQLFLFLLEEQRGDAGPQQGFISAEQLLLELKAGGIRLEQEAAVRLELQRFPPLDLLDFLAYLPLFMLIHKSVISNPLDDSCRT